MKFLSAQAPENRGFFVLVENNLKNRLQVWIGGVWWVHRMARRKANVNGDLEMTYSEAKKKANKRNAGKVFTGDAGNDCTFEVYYCEWRKRQIWTTINKNGFRF